MRPATLVAWLGLALLPCIGPAVSAQAPPARAAPDTIPLAMRTPRAGFDRLVVSVTVCAPGTARCVTIDDVMVDTGSTGLRLEASAVPGWLHLPPLPGPAGKALAECLRFVHDTAWGPLVRADVRLGGLTATDLPIQIIADGAEQQPAACPLSASPPTSKGTLGIGPQLFDCGGDCVQSAARPGVFTQEGETWMPVRGAVAPAYRLPNPVSHLPRHDDGVVLDMPEAPAAGSDAVHGTLRFGLGAQPPSGSIIRLDARGRFTTLYRGARYPDSYIDSGTETTILTDDRLPRCAGTPWAFCATPAMRREAEIVGQDGTRLPLSFRVGDYAAMRARHVGASDAFAVAAEPGSRAFVWGAPFFLGRHVTVLLDGRGAAGVFGPAYAIR